jgi:hypothetical protein
VNINLKYKIEDKDSDITLSIIRAAGFENALDLAYAKALRILDKDEESILSVMLLAWSHNLLADAREAVGKEMEDLRYLAYFYRKLAHKVYFYQRKDNSIAMLPGFLQPVE